MLHRTLSRDDDPATSYLIDHDAAATASLRTYLRRHKLRSKLQIGSGPDPDLVVAAAWRNPLDVGAGQSSDADVAAAEEWLEERKRGWDPRVVGMGRRWVESAVGEKRTCRLLLNDDRQSLFLFPLNRSLAHAGLSVSFFRRRSPCTYSSK